MNSQKRRSSLALINGGHQQNSRLLRLRTLLCITSEEKNLRRSTPRRKKLHSGSGSKKNMSKRITGLGRLVLYKQNLEWHNFQLCCREAMESFRLRLSTTHVSLISP